MRLSGIAAAAAARLAGVVGVAALAVVISVAGRSPHHPAVHFCCGYTPARLAAGAWWTVFGSALFVVHMNLHGINTALLVGVLLPYGLREGSRRALAVFFTGHALATLAVAAVVLPLAAWGWHPAEVVRVRADVGASAGVAAVAGAVAMSMRRRRWGTALLGALAAFFAVSLLLFHLLSDVEHGIALGVGALLGLRWRRGSSARFIAGSWRPRQAERRQGREESQAMAEQEPTGAVPEELADLAWMVDCAVTFGDRGRAAALAQRLLEELSRHYRAMRPLRLRCAPHVGAALADEAFALIGDVEQIAVAAPNSADRSGAGQGAVTDFRPRVERLVAHEAAEMAALGQQF